jgi:triacylglycerol lipase
MYFPRTIAALLPASLLTACAGPGPVAHAALRVASPPVKRVVIVHGIFDTKITMIPLRKSLEKAGFECFVPSLDPVDGRDGLEPMARQLGQAIDAEFGPDAPFSIVAFSMGGLVSRHYLQNLAGTSRCKGLHTIATPHNGTWLAYLYPGEGTRQMRPGSPFLTALNGSASVFDTVPATAYRSPWDGVVLPARNAAWDKADNVEIRSLLHPSLLWRKPLHKDLAQRLEKEHREQGRGTGLD